MPTPQVDDLMKELNGESDAPPEGKWVGEAPTPAPTRDEELTVGAAKAPPSITRQMDAQFATNQGGHGYKVNLKGEYLAESSTGKGKIRKEFEISVNLPKLDAALSIIKNRLLKPAMKKKYPDFIVERTVYVVDATPLSPATPKSNNLAYMDFDQLKTYAAQVRAPIDPAAYFDVIHLRDAIIDWTQTPDGFKDREAVRQAARAEEREIAALNPGL